MYPGFTMMVDGCIEVVLAAIIGLSTSLSIFVAKVPNLRGRGCRAGTVANWLDQKLFQCERNILVGN